MKNLFLAAMVFGFSGTATQAKVCEVKIELLNSILDAQGKPTNTVTDLSAADAKDCYQYGLDRLAWWATGNYQYNNMFTGFSVKDGSTEVFSMNTADKSHCNVVTWKNSDTGGAFTYESLPATSAADCTKLAAQDLSKEAIGQETVNSSIRAIFYGKTVVSQFLK